MLPAPFAAPLLIVQHMPGGFTRPLPIRLNAVCAIEVAEGEEGMKMRAGRAIVVPSGKHASGMPRAAWAAGLLDEVLALEDIPDTLCALTGTRQRVS